MDDLAQAFDLLTIDEPASTMADPTTDPSVPTPACGGVLKGVAWTGGSYVNPPTHPYDVLCFRPDDMRMMQRQHEQLKKGLDDSKRLELPDGPTKKTTLVAWMQEMKLIVETRGFDTVFRVTNDDKTKETYLMDRWSEITTEEVENFCATLTDHYDKENLRLSAYAVRDSLGPHLHERVATLTDPATTSGPVYLKNAIDQVQFMSASTLRNLSNELGSLKLKSIEGENVAKLSEKVSTLAREIAHWP